MSFPCIHKKGQLKEKKDCQTLKECIIVNVFWRDKINDTFVPGPIIMLIGESRGLVFKGFSANTVRPL